MRLSLGILGVICKGFSRGSFNDARPTKGTSRWCSQTIDQKDRCPFRRPLPWEGRQQAQQDTSEVCRGTMQWALEAHRARESRSQRRQQTERAST